MAKTMDVSSALDAPANIADIPINAARGIEIPALEKKLLNESPNNPPVAAPIVNNGASVPPDVPLPKAMAHETNFNKQREITTLIGKVPERRSVILHCHIPSVRGAKYPIITTASPPIAGHHIQGILSFSKSSSIK